MKQELYIIKGTGFNLDGTVVAVIDRLGDYVVVSPSNSKVSITNVMVHNKCLQPMDDAKTVNYQFMVFKYEDGKSPVEKSFLVENALRNVDLDTIEEYITLNLAPILRMD